MSDVTITPAARQPVINDAGAPGQRPAVATQPAATPASATPATPAHTDTVQLSSAAQTALAGSSRPVLNESQATQTSSDLRQALGASKPLSGTAKQNQAILSLLR